MDVEKALFVVCRGASFSQWNVREAIVHSLFLGLVRFACTGPKAMPLNNYCIYLIEHPFAAAL